MSRQVDIKALVSHIVRGDGGDKCRICMGETSEGQVFLGDTVMLDGNKPVTLAELLETITGVAVIPEGDLPEALCMVCACSAKEAGNFRIFCEEAVNQWDRTLLLMETFPLPEYLPDCNKCICFVMKDDEVTIINELNEHYNEHDYDHIKQNDDNEPDDVYHELYDDYEQLDISNNSDIECYKTELEVQEANKYSENKKPMRCPDCGKTFKYPRLMLQHFEQLTHKRRACFICTRVMSRDSLINHFVQEHDIQCYPCKECPAIFQSMHQFMNHKSKAHKLGQSHACTDCGRSFQSVYALNAHIGVHTAKNCPSCDKMFRNQVCYRYHVKQCCDLHDNKNDMTKTKEVKNLKSNKCIKVGLRGAAEQNCICDYCGKKFKGKNAIAVHIQVTHTKSTHIPCKFCGRLFAASHMKKHYKTHQQTESYPCEFCGFVLQSKEGYKCHVRLHTGERPYTCKLCGEKFTTSSNHSMHVNTVHKSYEDRLKYICSLCPARYRFTRGLRRHMAREHADFQMPQHKCDICLKNFFSSNGLKNHKTRSHQPISR